MNYRRRVDDPGLHAEARYQNDPSNFELKDDNPYDRVSTIPARLDGATLYANEINPYANYGNNVTNVAATN